MQGDQPAPPQSSGPYPSSPLSQDRCPTSVPTDGHLLMWVLTLRAPSLPPKEDGQPVWVKQHPQSTLPPSLTPLPVCCSPHSIS